MESYVVLALMHFTTMQTAPEAPVQVADTYQHNEIHQTTEQPTRKG